MGDNTLGSTDGAALAEAGPINAAGSKAVPAHYQERTTKTGQQNLEVSVRIPSFPQHHPLEDFFKDFFKHSCEDLHEATSARGAIYQVDPAKSTNRLYNHACNGGAAMTTLADFQSVEFPRAEGYLPLVGLPIGAGPEGAPGLSHMGQFEDCVLHTKRLIACLGDGPAACLLASKSKSFACLHEATGARCDPLGFDWRQEALTGRERARSAEPSEYGDSGENEQLHLS
ncbi:hypothetical protein KVR01_005016 [Diaporthe batatas]|uniref:uncharacterized protein n=1 Tax=Diaporthe batatas TaxID=748121 RepID=UPI001D042382|nr:uncharacterized protein KVR01_005016 [Diaporthe batatas]KAG8164741.1 hypothetical protein KVR01_005016 [Diaporthe batatas]